MAGLLYKDFVGIKGRYQVIVFSVLTLLFLVFRLLLPGNAGEWGEFLDYSGVTFVLMIVVISMMFISRFTTSIIANDELHNAMQFTKSLPLEKNSYIASKYIFIGILTYVFYSLSCVWAVIYISVCYKEAMSDWMRAVMSILLPLYGMMLILAAIELPFFITFGLKRAGIVKNAIMELLLFFVVGFVLFGDLDVLNNIDLGLFVHWVETHTLMLLVLNVTQPLTVLFFYYLSYRLTCRINKDREVLQ